MDVFKKNKAEKAALDAKSKAAKEIETYCAEGRMHLINAILAYDDAFHFFGDEPLDEEDIEDIECTDITEVSFKKEDGTYMDDVEQEQYMNEHEDELYDLVNTELQDADIDWAVEDD